MSRKPAFAILLVLLCAAMILVLVPWGAAPVPGEAADFRPSDPEVTAPEQGAMDPVAGETRANTARKEVAAGSSATTGSLVVTVRWHDGTPAAGVAISFRERGSAYRTLLRPVSDREGRVRSGPLPVGPLSLRSDRGGDLKVEVLAGVEQEVELILPEGIAVAGVVIDRRDQPVAGASVWLQTPRTYWSAGRVVARTAADGTFALRDIPRDLSLGALAAGFSPSTLVDLDTVDTSSPPVVVRLVLEDGAGAVEGRVVNRLGIPVAGALVAVGKRPRHLKYRGGGSYGEVWTARTEVTGEDGRFSIDGLQPGTPPVAVRARGYGLWRGEVEVMRDVTFRMTITLDVEVTISGTVRDQDRAPLSGARVRIYDKAPREDFIVGGQIDFYETFGYIAVVCDPQGRYRATGLAPGSVYLYAQTGGGHIDKPVPYAKEVLTAEPGEHLTWNPVISPGRTIEGVVLYRDGHPMGGVFITARDEGGGPSHVQVNNKEGRFQFVCLEGASYSLHVQYWTPPAGTPPLEKLGVIPDRSFVELLAPFDKPIKGPQGMVTGRVDDAGGRLAHAEALKVLLRSSKNWWRTCRKVAKGAFVFDGVEAGRYRIVALSVEQVIGAGAWFELAAGEARDVGTLTTELAGTVAVRLDRRKGTEELEPTLHLRGKEMIHGPKIAMGRRSAAKLTNVTPGSYTVTGYGAGMARLQGRVEVRAGQEAELRFTLEPAVRRKFEVWFPVDHPMGTLTVSIIGADGTEYWSLEEPNGPSRSRPYRRTLSVPRGQWVFKAVSGTGLEGEAAFSVQSLDADYPAVRVDLK